MPADSAATPVAMSCFDAAKYGERVNLVEGHARLALKGLVE